MNEIYDRKFVEEIKKSTLLTKNQLFQKSEKFYYPSLTIDENGLTPVFSAWSWEALKQVSIETTSPIEWIKWSYSDSPYFNFNETNFSNVKIAFENRGNIYTFQPHQWPDELSVRINSMECALHELDLDGVFGTEKVRDSIVINAEIVPPDAANTSRARRLNPPAALKDWLIEAAE